MVSSRCGERLADAVAEVWLSGDCRERPRRDPQASSAVPLGLSCRVGHRVAFGLGPDSVSGGDEPPRGRHGRGRRDESHRAPDGARLPPLGYRERRGSPRTAGPLPGHGRPAHEGGGERGRGEYAGAARGRVGQMPPPAQALHSSRLPSTARAAKYAFPRHAPIAQLDRASDYEQEPFFVNPPHPR